MVFCAVAGSQNIPFCLYCIICVCVCVCVCGQDLTAMASGLEA
jgi:hypothetical protein